MMLLTQSLKEANLGEFETYHYVHEFKFALEEIWAPKAIFTFYQESLYKKEESSDRPRFSRSGPPPIEWSIAFTSTFRKSISGIDKKLQGRVLAAIAELSEKPALPHGDTKKPLNAELKGLWRYRVGDYRLIYRPDEEKRMVVLLEFAARGEIYEA